MVTCTVSHKSYIGWAFDVERRWQRHMFNAHTGMDLCFYRAIRKYGTQNFRIRVLGTFFSRHAACRAEKLCIRKYRTISPTGYNVSSGGEWGATSEMVKKGWIRTGPRPAAAAAIKEAKRLQGFIRLSIAAKKGKASMTQKQRSAVGYKRAATMGPERPSAARLKGMRTMGPERRFNAAIKGRAAAGHTKISEAAKAWQASRTLSARSASSKKAWNTRRSNTSAGVL